MKRSSWMIGITLPVMLVLGACVAPSSLSSVNFAVQIEPIPAEPIPVGRIELPDGTVCLHAGMGATLAFDEKRLNYTCTEPVREQVGLLGDLQPEEGGLWSIEKATFTHGDDGFTLVSSETVSALATGLALEDGTECLHTGEGATLAFNEKRLNYVCRSEGDEIQGLIGDPIVVNGLEWEAELASIGRSGAESENKYVLEESAIVAVWPVRIVVDGGLQCLFAGEGATPAFDGKRLNYSCENVSHEQLGLLGDIVDAGASRWRVEKTRIESGTTGYALASSEEVEFRLGSISLADGTICAFAGEGATLAFDGKRANFTCGASGESGENTVVVLGDPQPGAGGEWLAERATLAREGEGFALASTEMLPVVAVHGIDATGAALALKAALPVPVGVWQWDKTVTASNSLVAPRDPTLYTLQFVPDGALYIRADCNSGRGSYEISGESLTIGPLALTRAACAPGSLSEPFVGQVANAVSLQVAETELTVGLQDGSTMTFAAQE